MSSIIYGEPAARFEFLRTMLRRNSPFPRDDMENMPELGIAAWGDAVGFLFLEHFEVEACQQRQRFFAADESHAGPSEPAVARAVPLAAEAAAIGQGLADALPYPAKRFRFAERHGEARIHEPDIDRQRHLLQSCDDRREVAPGGQGAGLQLSQRLRLGVDGHDPPA